MGLQKRQAEYWTVHTTTKQNELLRYRGPLFKAPSNSHIQIKRFGPNHTIWANLDILSSLVLRCQTKMASSCDIISSWQLWHLSLKECKGVNNVLLCHCRVFITDCLINLVFQHFVDSSICMHVFHHVYNKCFHPGLVYFTQRTPQHMSTKCGPVYEQ